MGTRMIKRVIYGILAILWMGIIYSFSAKTGTQSAGTSGGVTRLLLNIFYPQYNDLPYDMSVRIFETCHFVIRKLAHFTEYAILAELVMLFAATFTDNGVITWKTGFIIVLLCGLYAAGDEFHQMFVGGRSPQIRDVIIDTLGALTGMADCRARWIMINYMKGRNNR